MRTSQVRVSNSYKRGIWIAILIALCGVFGFAYVTFSKATITITPQIKELKSEMMIEVVENEDLVAGNIIKGTMEEDIEIVTQMFKSSGIKTVNGLEDLSAIGSVTIVNNLNRKMDLIPRTRLLSADDTLYRLKDRVSIPAGAKREVIIYPDEPEKFEKLAEGRMTIPGLSDSLQKDVYAENQTEISKEKKNIPIITDEDIALAVKKLTQDMRRKKANEIKLQYTDNAAVSVALTSEVIETVTDKIAGEEGKEFELTVRMRMTSVLMDRAQLLERITEDMQRNIPPGERLMQLSTESNALNFVIEKIDLDSRIANVKVNAIGFVSITKDHPSLDKEKVVNTTKSQAEIYYKSLAEVKSVKVQLSPFWVTKVPMMLDKIEIKLQ